MAKFTSSEVGGFVGWIASFLAFFAYVAWCLCSAESLESIGVTYYPDRYWALAAPVIVLVGLATVFFGYNFLNILYAPVPSSLKIVTDRHSRAPSEYSLEALQHLASAASSALFEASGGSLVSTAQIREKASSKANLREAKAEASERPRRDGRLADIPLSLSNGVLFPLNRRLLLR